ncbi:MAG: TolC family protein, partial [Bacteroidaceae bacterium]|nr:TolC family protein [Bacteroidaceae bacterium]
DISLLERNMIATLASELHTRWIEVREEMNLAQKRLKWSCYAEENLVPEDTLLKHWDFNSQPDRLSSAHLNYFESLANEKYKTYKWQNSRFFPEFNVGFNLQKIAPDKGLKSWMVGMSVPLLFMPQRSRSRQAKLDWRIAQWEAKQNATELQNKLLELDNRHMQQMERLNYYTEAALHEADALRESAVLQFKEGETNIVTLVQSINSALSIREGYMLTLYNHNVSVLEMELYTD